MIFIADFSPIKPDFGLLFWSVIFFLLFWFLIGKFAFKSIANALKQRSQDIQDALDQAKKTREEMAQLVSENEQLLAQAREERAQILKEAKEIKEQIIAEAKRKADQEFQHRVNSAKDVIENLKQESIIAVKNEAGILALELAGKLLRKELSDSEAHRQYVNTLLEEYKLN